MTSVDDGAVKESKLYRPSNGTEGADFMSYWCCYCERDAAFQADPDRNGRGCEILADTFVYDVTDPKYPREWNYGPDGRPRCTAFTSDPSLPVRCEKTIDMFASLRARKEKE